MIESEDPADYLFFISSSSLFSSSVSRFFLLPVLTASTCSGVGSGSPIAMHWLNSTRLFRDLTSFNWCLNISS